VHLPRAICAVCLVLPVPFPGTSLPLVGVSPCVHVLLSLTHGLVTLQITPGSRTVINQLHFTEEETKAQKTESLAQNQSTHGQGT
jgi:hypothetical protein